MTTLKALWNKLFGNAAPEPQVDWQAEYDKSQEMPADLGNYWNTYGDTRRWLKQALEVAFTGETAPAMTDELKADIAALDAESARDMLLGLLEYAHEKVRIEAVLAHSLANPSPLHRAAAWGDTNAHEQDVQESVDRITVNLQNKGILPKTEE